MTKEQLQRRVSNLEFELTMLEHVRLRDNQYLINQRDKAQALADHRAKLLDSLIKGD